MSLQDDIEDRPLTDAELDALDRDWKPLGLLFAGIVFSRAPAYYASIERCLEFRDRVNAVRGNGYWDPWEWRYDDA